MSFFDHDMSGPISLQVNGEERTFNIDDPDLPDWVSDHKLSAGNYPYKDKLDRDDYEKELYHLQVELVKLQYWQEDTGQRIVSIFEGRDAAGKGGAIGTMRENMNPRRARIVALPKPSDRERGEWYFQRYVRHLPTAGEMVLFDRSWYNRAGVERVMGFCNNDQCETFLNEAPNFEAAITRDGIHLFKFWLAIGRETQLKRFHDRRHDPRKIWKLSPMDIASLNKWDDYTHARREMLLATHTPQAPWTVVRMNDKKRGRLNLLRHFLHSINYADKDESVIGKVDPKIVTDGPSCNFD